MTFNNSAQSVEYLVNRGLNESTITDLGIHWVSYEDATTHRYGYGKLSTSPEGLIIFPLEKVDGDRIISVARNFYSNDESQAAHLELINQDRQSKQFQPIKRTPKYLLPSGDRAKGKLYDPYSILHPETDTPVFFATEDVIGVAKAASQDLRIVSTFGVWLVANSDLEDRQEDEWTHPMARKFPVFLADSDAIEKASVYQALIRTGFVVGCNIGYFPSEDKTKKVGLDEWLNANPDATELALTEMVSANSADALTWLEENFLKLQDILCDRGYNKTEAAQISSPVRDAALNELLKHLDIDDLRANGFYQQVLKPMGIVLEGLKNRERAIKLDSGELDSQDTIAQVLIRIGLEADYFKSPDKLAYADLNIDSHRETYPVRSRGFKLWLACQLYEQSEQSANSEAMRAALNTLEAKALFNSEERTVDLRTAEHQGRIYIDLCNEQWQAIEVSPDGWRIVSDAPVRFIRSDAMLPLPIPEQGGKLADLRELIHVPDPDWVLLLCYILFALTPSGSKPVLMVTGEAGGGKSTLCRWLQYLIDPCKAPLLKGCPDSRDMAVIASSRWLLTIDNESYLSDSQSDDLCRLATGGGFLTRKLFTDEEVTCIEYRRPAIVNAIDAVATRGDLIDRSLMIGFNRIPEAKRLDEKVLESKFTKLQPSFFGCLLDGMVTALQKYPSTKLDKSPRMADFARFAVAAETGLGFTAGSFLEAYTGALKVANQTAVESSPLANAIERFMGDRSEWSGTPTQLLEGLQKITTQETRGKTWPQMSNRLTRQLNRLATVLRAVDIEVVASRTNGARLISLGKISKSPQESNTGNLSSLPSPDEKESPDALQGKDCSGDGKSDGNTSSPKVTVTDDGKSDGNFPSPKVTVTSETSSGKGLHESSDGSDSSDGKNPTLDFTRKTEKLLKVGDRVKYVGQRYAEPYRDRLMTVRSFEGDRIVCELLDTQDITPSLDVSDLKLVEVAIDG